MAQHTPGPWNMVLTGISLPDGKSDAGEILWH